MGAILRRCLRTPARLLGRALVLQTGLAPILPPQADRTRGEGLTHQRNRGWVGGTRTPAPAAGLRTHASEEKIAPTGLAHIHRDGEKWREGSHEVGPAKGAFINSGP